MAWGGAAHPRLLRLLAILLLVLAPAWQAPALPPPVPGALALELCTAAGIVARGVTPQPAAPADEGHRHGHGICCLMPGGGAGPAPPGVVAGLPAGAVWRVAWDAAPGGNAPAAVRQAAWPRGPPAPSPA